jgi:hypothetical protein
MSTAYRLGMLTIKRHTLILPEAFGRLCNRQASPSVLPQDVDTTGRARVRGVSVAMKKSSRVAKRMSLLVAM